MRRIVLLAALVAALVAQGARAAGTAHHDEPSAGEGVHEAPEPHDDHAMHERHGHDVVTSMSQPHAHMGPHFRWTTLRPTNPADQRKAASIVEELQKVLAPYRDYRKAIEDGYEPFLPDVVQPHYHFTNKWRSFKSAFRFNPGQPTSLLYKKTPQGYELEGAMYTAPKRAGENDLDKRIPLSVAQWHAHVDICLPPKKEVRTADWTRFGPKGSIVTERDCDAVKGRWILQLFGWMVHVYPFAAPENIWKH